MDNNLSEIDDEKFFLSINGKIDPKAELLATLNAFYNDEKKDDNSSICKFPARYSWIQKKLNAKDFPTAVCSKYEKIYNRVDPKSVTLVFPSAHINSPASMFGHTFLRVNSSYNSKLLSYAINYAANANTTTENGMFFAIKGIFGGYFGTYSLLPYYEKLKEYRDSEQRDIWEYNLNFTPEETQRMFRHIWELNGTHSYYYFLTENCSYNMLWLLEAARPGLDMRSSFLYQVAPLESVHIANEKNIISDSHYRPSKRTILLKYEELIDDEYINLPLALVESKTSILEIMNDQDISLTQKRYIFEATIENLEYRFSKGKVEKELYLEMFHNFTTQRSKLGYGDKLNIETPANPLESHRAIRVQTGVGDDNGEFKAYLGIRPAYHDLEDSNYGFLRGTQIEFMDILLSKSRKKFQIEHATLLSIVSLAQRSEFFKSLSWRTKIGFNRDYINEDSTFSASVGAGYSWGNELAYIYMMIDPIFYVNDTFRAGIGSSIGLNFDKYKQINTNLEFTKKVYDNGRDQTIIKASQGFNLTQNSKIVLKYDYIDRYVNEIKEAQHSFIGMFRYYY